MTTLYFDLESDGLLDEATTIHCLYTHDLESGEIKEYTDGIKTGLWAGSIEEGIESLIDSNVIVGHNSIFFDIPLISKLYGIAVEHDYPHHVDDLILSRWLNPRRVKPRGSTAGPHSMESWGIRLGHHKRGHEDWSTLTPDMLERCKGDVILGGLIHAKLLGKLESVRANGDILKLEHQFAKEVVTTAVEGHPFSEELACEKLKSLDHLREELRVSILSRLQKDLVSSDKAKGTYLKALKLNGARTVAALKYQLHAGIEVCGDICRVAWEKVDLDSHAKVKKVLLSFGWVPDAWNFSKITKERTSPQLTESSYHTLPTGLGKELTDYLMVTHRVRLLRGLIAATSTDRDGVSRIKYSINTLGTAAHRVTHRIVVNLPGNNRPHGKDIRSLFTAEPGEVLVGCDLSGAHLHEVAVWMKDPVFLEALVNGDKELGTDAHTLNANAWGVTRDQAKVMIYTYMNGGKEGRIAEQIGCTPSRAKEVMNSVGISMPNLDGLIANLVRFWKQNGYIETPAGARLYPKKTNDVLSYVMLGTEATVMKGAIVTALGWMRDTGHPIRLLTMNHDDCIVTIKEELSGTWVHYLKEAVKYSCGLNGIDPPMELDSQVGYTWADVH